MMQRSPWGNKGHFGEKSTSSFCFFVVALPYLGFIGNGCNGFAQALPYPAKLSTAKPR